MSNRFEGMKRSALDAELTLNSGISPRSMSVPWRIRGAYWRWSVPYARFAANANFTLGE
jgi:hypothetical protein